MSKSNVIAFSSPSAKAALQKTAKASRTTAKDAATPASKQKLADEIKAAAATKSRLNSPSLLARCRQIAGGDICAGQLLYRIAHLWAVINPKLLRGNQEWLAQTKADWAMSAGLSEKEVTRAIKRLKTHAYEVVTIRAMGNGADKKLGVWLDVAAYEGALNEAGYELKVAAQNGVPGYP